MGPLPVSIHSFQKQVIISENSKSLVSVCVHLASPATPAHEILPTTPPSHNHLLPWQLTLPVSQAYYNLLPATAGCLGDSKAPQGTAGPGDKMGHASSWVGHSVEGWGDLGEAHIQWCWLSDEEESSLTPLWWSCLRWSELIEDSILALGGSHQPLGGTAALS